MDGWKVLIDWNDPVLYCYKEVLSVSEEPPFILSLPPPLSCLSHYCRKGKKMENVTLHIFSVRNHLHEGKEISALKRGRQQEKRRKGRQEGEKTQETIRTSDLHLTES
mmetsp:Transcript_4594/g.9222  ORF Transcript_4594/g.9222 Transcript_4594/m.9222 type:complete len:108 (+) Transcript_4594:952-1275(+)